MNTTPSIPASAPPLKLTGLGLVLAGGLLGGLGDIVFAFIYYAPTGATPIRILQYIASGVLGPASFQMGLGSAALGAFLHFFTSVCAAFVFFLVSTKFTFLTFRWLISGLVFGVLMFLAMRLVVVPLSAVKVGPMKISSIIGELCSHMFLFGIPIAYTVSRAALRRRT